MKILKEIPLCKYLEKSNEPCINASCMSHMLFHNRFTESETTELIDSPNHRALEYYLL